MCIDSHDAADQRRSRRRSSRQLGPLRVRGVESEGEIELEIEERKDRSETTSSSSATASRSTSTRSRRPCWTTRCCIRSHETTPVQLDDARIRSYRPRVEPRQRQFWPTTCRPTAPDCARQSASNVAASTPSTSAADVPPAAPGRAKARIWSPSQSVSEVPQPDPAELGVRRMWSDQRLPRVRRRLDLVRLRRIVQARFRSLIPLNSSVEAITRSQSGRSCGTTRSSMPASACGASRSSSRTTSTGSTGARETQSPAARS